MWLLQIRDWVLRNLQSNKFRKKVKIIIAIWKQFKINNYNCYKNNCKKLLWNQSSTRTSSQLSNHLQSSNHSQPKQIPHLHLWFLNRSSVCKSKWRRASGWCVTRSIWLRGVLRMHRANLRCLRSSKLTTKTGKCNVNLLNLSNLGDFQTHLTNNNRRCEIRSLGWINILKLKWCLAILAKEK